MYALWIADWDDAKARMRTGQGCDLFDLDEDEAVGGFDSIHMS